MGWRAADSAAPAVRGSDLPKRVGPMKSSLLANVLAALGVAGGGAVLTACSGSLGEPSPGVVNFKQIDMIDEMEDFNPSAFIPDRGGRTGQWFAFRDKTSTGQQGNWRRGHRGVNGAV